MDRFRKISPSPAGRMANPKSSFSNDVGAKANVGSEVTNNLAVSR